MCKIWKCTIDDPIFSNITGLQWYTYSLLIANDKKNDAEEKIALAEYLASFWNAEAVKKIRESREQVGQHKFQADDEFEKSIMSGKYKENPLLDAIIKLKNNEAVGSGVNNDEQGSGQRPKVPSNLSSIYNTLNKFDK